MKKNISNLGSLLTKERQQKINGGGFPRPGCYAHPTTDVDCISPWIYVSGCGYTCMIAPTGP